MRDSHESILSINSPNYVKINLLIILCTSFLFTSCATIFRSEAPLTAAPPSKNLWSYVDKNGKVDYSSLVDSPAAINYEYELLAERSPDSHPSDFPTEKDRLAYWLNAYNISVIYAVTQLYPIDSVQDHRPVSIYSLISGGGFFAAQKFSYGGKRLSLYTLENKVIRKRFSDPRIHFGLNCASTSCPDLASQPFRKETVDQQLDQLAKNFINSPKALAINHEAKEIQLSAIFEWYEKDFQPNALGYIEPYLENSSELREAQAKGYSVSYLPYDWSLNKQ